MDADSYASACDQETGEKGILHGIPVSLKESYYLRVSQIVCVEDRERSGSVVECLTGDRGAVGPSLTGFAALCP